ncbi:hypothetical protein RLIN73S_06475 [Rhodanobacter lindaniclasticus]
MVQAQGDVGILGGVAAGGIQVHLRERDLLRALAGHLFVLHRLIAEILLRQRVHVVARGGGVPHVGLQHRVVPEPLHGDAVVRQDVDVVLRVLAQLGPRRVLEDRLQRGQHGIAIELRRHAGVVVAERDVAGPARLHREAEADDVRAHRVEAGGLGVERDQLGVAQFLQPGVELRLGGDEFVLAGSGKARSQMIGARDRAPLPSAPIRESPCG